MDKHKRPNKGVHMKRHEYGESSGHDRRQRQGRGNGRGEAQHQAKQHKPRYMTLAEGQQDPEVRELLEQKFARLTVIIYGPRLAGSDEFESETGFIPPQGGQDDPIETFGNFSAGDLFEDMFAHGFVCTGAKYRSRDEAEFGDNQGKTYLYFRRRSDIRPDKKTGKTFYLRPHYGDYVNLQADLKRLQIFKTQLFLTALDRGGIKHTLKLFAGTPRQKGRLEKPVWKAVAREWVFESAQRSGQQPAHTAQTENAAITMQPYS
jgi:hypothetical protein